MHTFVNNSSGDYGKLRCSIILRIPAHGLSFAMGIGMEWLFVYTVLWTPPKYYLAHTNGASDGVPLPTYLWMY